MKIHKWQLKQRQSLSLEGKVQISKNRIKQWYKYWNGDVYVAFSGGKDSTVLLHLVREMYPDVPAVFCNTGLEYPEIVQFVKNVDNVIWLKPKMNFYNVIKKYGFPVISKRIARFIHDIQNRNEKNKNTVNLRLTGFNRKGIFCSTMKLPDKWLPLAYSDIKVSERCCDFLKKYPMKLYEKKTNRKPFIGNLACESSMRELQYLKQGCNAFENKTKPISTPIAFWKTEDIYEYKKKKNIEFSKIYQIELSTGCMFCMFGVHLEKGKNRFQRMKITHPKHYNYCINKLGCGNVLKFIGVEY